MRGLAGHQTKAHAGLRAREAVSTILAGLRLAEPVLEAGRAVLAPPM